MVKNSPSSLSLQTLAVFVHIFLSGIVICHFDEDAMYALHMCNAYILWEKWKLGSFLVALLYWIT